jgi:hypothetical protein
MHDRPLTVAGAREPTTRTKPIPKAVRNAVQLMVYGRLDDPDCQPLDFIQAARESGIKPDQMRRYLDRPAIRALLMQERRAFRAAICAGNEAALLRVRQTSPNGMAICASVRALEQIGEEEERRGPGGSIQQSAGLTIVITHAPAPVAGSVTVDVTPVRQSRREAAYESPTEPAPYREPAPEAEYVPVYRDLAEPPRPYSAPRDMPAAPKLPGDVGYRAPTQPRNRRRI